jgi:hypothetical protein
MIILEVHSEGIDDCAVQSDISFVEQLLQAFYPFVDDGEVELIGAEAGGRGIKSGIHAASLVAGEPLTMRKDTEDFLRQGVHNLRQYSYLSYLEPELIISYPMYG